MKSQHTPEPLFEQESGDMKTPKANLRQERISCTRPVLVFKDVSQLITIPEDAKCASISIENVDSKAKTCKNQPTVGNFDLELENADHRDLNGVSSVAPTTTEPF